MQTRLLILADYAFESAPDFPRGAECVVLPCGSVEEVSEEVSRHDWTHLLRVRASESISGKTLSDLFHCACVSGAGITYGIATTIESGARVVPVSRLRHALRIWNAIPIASIVSRDVWTRLGGLRNFDCEEIAWWDFAIRTAHSDVNIEFCEGATIQRRGQESNRDLLSQWRGLAALVTSNPDAFERPQRLWADLILRDSSENLSSRERLGLLDLSFPRLLEWSGWYEAAFEYARLREDVVTPCLSASGQLQWRNIVNRLRAFNGHLDFKKSSDVSDRGRARKASPVFGIDIRPLSIPSTRNRGIGRYVISALRALLEIESNVRFVLLGEEDALDSTGIEDIASHTRVSYRCYAEGCDEELDCFLLTDPSPVMRGRHTKALPVRTCAWGSIVYDLIPLEFPDQYLASDNELLDDYLDNLKTLTLNCTAYFPISDYVGAEISRRLKIPSSEITPIYGGNWSNSRSRREHGQLHIDAPYFLYVGGADSRKNLNRLLAAFVKFISETKSPAKLVLVGEMTREKTLARLTSLCLAHHSERIVGLGGVDDNKLENLYANAEATVFVSLSEGLGLPALEAMSCGCPVIGSNNSALGETIGEAGLLVNPYSVHEICEAMKKIASSPTLRDDLKQKGYARSSEWTWKRVAETLMDGLHQLAWKNSSPTPKSRKLEVAMLNRLNVWSAPGGDGEVMKQMREAAALRDISITFRESVTHGPKPDIVHFVNLTLAKLLNEITDEAERARTPLVLTTLFEDWPLYMQTSQEVSAILMEYARGKLTTRECESLLANQRHTSKCPQAGSNDAVNSVSALLACGSSEAARLCESYPAASDRVHVVPFAVRKITQFESSGIEQIWDKLGMDRFVLCCGRLETRKNQLMLLKALEDSDIGIVFTAGGYTPQPAYAEAVRNFVREGKTLILGRLERKSLDGLMRAATVHALPSFYELPGLVHLEAAVSGASVVASTWGALTDYLPVHLLHPCEPDSPESVRVAIERAMSSAPSRALADLAATFTQERLADDLLRVYESVLASTKNRARAKKTELQNKKYLPSERGEIHALC